MVRARDRLEQEVVRLAGNYAHVLDDSVESRHDDVRGEAGCMAASLEGGSYTFIGL